MSSIFVNSRRIAFMVSRISQQRLYSSFYEKDPKSGYSKGPKKTQLKAGLQQLKKEIQAWKKQIKNKLESDPILVHRQNEVDIYWKFDTAEALEDWIVTSDSDHLEGFSKCSFTHNKLGYANFSGYLNTKVPKDGRIKRTGYCSITQNLDTHLIQFEPLIDWKVYNTVVLKIRGDGRNYMFNLHTKGYFDVLWNDMYSYILYTRGGPYWQIVKIPYSYFILSSKGRVQDKQAPLPAHKITSLGITAADKINGHFNLEIEYIGLMFDSTLTEEFAYEMYKTEKYIVGV